VGRQYLNLVRLGENQWWRYLLGILLILTIWFSMGSMLYLVPIISWGAFAVLSSGDARIALDATSFEDFVESVPPLVTFTGTFLMFVPLLVGIVFVVRFVHHRPFRTLITPRKRVDWVRFGQGFLLFGALLILITVIEALLYPGRYQFALNLGRFLPFLIVGLILIPIQTASEELLFRGYSMQGLSLLVRSPILVALTSGLIFTLPHLANPELSAGFWLVAPQYFVVGLALAVITLKDNGLELALGVHTVNNLFVGLVATFPDSAIQGETLFVSTTIDPVYSLISVVVVYVLFYVIVFGSKIMRRADWMPRATSI
jgi:membrane protease YdiL (CAAX protease family)